MVNKGRHGQMRLSIICLHPGWHSPDVLEQILKPSVTQLATFWHICNAFGVAVTLAAASRSCAPIVKSMYDGVATGSVVLHKHRIWR